MANPICSTNCIDDLPIARFPGCGGQGAFVKESEISRIFIGKANRTPFTDVSDPAEWVGIVDNTGASDTDQTLRVHEVIGDLPAASPVTKVISRKRTLTITKNRTVSWTVDIITQETYDGYRMYECGGTYPVWLETYAGQLYGGNKGILMTIDPNLILGRGDATEEIVVTGAWQAKFMPERTISPLYEGEVDDEDPGEGEEDDYDTVIAFSNSSNQSGASGSEQVQVSPTGTGITVSTPGTATANANTTFEIDAVSPRPGSPLSMTVYLGSVSQANLLYVFSGTTDYLSKPFRMKKNGATYNKSIKSGNLIV